MLSSKLCLCTCAQEVSCGKNHVQSRSVDERDEQGTTVAADGAAVNSPERDCGEYKSQIWDNSLRNPKTMQLARMTLETAEKMSTDPVCSDTVRSFINFAHVISTDENAHYVLGQLLRVTHAIAKQATSDYSVDMSKTKKLMLRVADSPEIRKSISKTIVRSAGIFQDPKNRARLMVMINAILGALKPSENEKMVMQTVNRIKGTITSPLTKTQDALKKLGSFIK